MFGLVAACSNNPSPSTEVTGSAEETLAPSSQSAPPSVGAAPVPSMAPIARAPLPAPELETAEEIGTALLTPVSRPQGVVSLLDQLGIGTYTDEGEPITPGAEVDGGTLWLAESEVHGLIEMAAAEDPRDFVEFRDWHAGLQELGLELSAEELVAAYEEAYFADTEASFFVNALFATGIDLHVDGRLTHLQAWLLLLDGFLVGADAEAGGIVLASYHEGQWGGASAFIPRLLVPGTLLTGAELFALLARLEPLIRATPLWLEPPSATAHEGHDGPGSETSLTLRFTPLPISIPAMDLGFQLVPIQMPAGLPVTFAASDPAVLVEHGTTRDPTGSDPFAGARPTPLMTDSNGTIRLTYTPREEEADGEGEMAVESVRVTASVRLRDIAAHTWVLPEVLLSILIGDRAVTTTLDVEWHELEGLRIEMTDEYDVTVLIGGGRAIGTDTFSGFLARQDDGTWRGVVHGEADAQVSFDITGCSTPLAGTQDLLAVAETLRNPVEGRDLGVRLYPISDPVITRQGCDYAPNRWPGDAPDDPTLPRGTGMAARDYAPFNNTLVTNPELGGVPARLPRSGSETTTWTESAAGFGSGTWTITIERVEPDR